MTNIFNGMPSIADKAMKVKLSRGTGYARIRDKEAEKLVKDQLGDQGQTVTKAIFKDKNCLIYRRSQLANEMYLYHVDNTLPHTDDGWRVLPNQLYLEYTSQMGAYSQQLQLMEQQIIANYHQLVATDIAQRNASLTGQGKPAAATVNDYPTLDHMKRLLYVQYYFEPINTAHDFRYEMNDADKSRLDDLVKEIEDNAKRDLYTRMLDPMKAFVDKLAVYKGDKGQRLHDSVVTNINDMLTKLPRLNLDADPVLQQMLDEVKVLVTPYVFNTDALREDEVVRDTAREKMQKLMDRYAGYAL